EVSLISPKAQKQDNSTLFDIEIIITDRDSVQLRAGYSANADIIIRRAQNALQIPERLLTFEEDSVFVEVETE
ncbi:MAG: efflux transporter periplasmic adaptor subunit, partial [Gammaproteobacteria bacterium]|nr:efflux transporter periplasmic adaptor subunit [Gammaproteobacteria bacterium]NIR95368.1 efflux transporter periplasmic adaptor subunit [Gammaproteobacteria bacterium]NIT53539.1 efflux transporter periplasmic adaptor subunit [candidate division Zixibacteria bacterium]NIW44198.1 efflux transporter periplasmic adaptor subunit [Gammaproteobacteria bacterium]NIX55323.1 efflux transporter periplasmic adaptor subunit [candidate division Zixibacteria bacterium]